MAKKAENREDDAYSVLPVGEYFPNGLPKVCHYYDEDDDRSDPGSGLV